MSEEWIEKREMYSKCLSQVNLNQEDPYQLAEELVRLAKCEIFPPILPASMLGKAKTAIDRYRLLKQAAMWTLRLCDDPREAWFHRRTSKFVVRIINQKGEEYSIPINCGTHALVNAQWSIEKYPIYTFQIPPDCVILPIV